jgi:hypothetical protein
MPQLSHLIGKRLQELLSSSPKKLADYSQPSSPGEVEGWLISGANLLHAVAANQPTHPYRWLVTAVQLNVNTNQAFNQAVTMLGVLRQLKSDFEAGLLSNLEAQIAAQTFEDLLDHAEAYLKQRRKQPAGVLTGVVFEDAIRKLCRRHNIIELGINLDLLLSELVKKDVITPIDRSDCTTAAKLRTSATHARWEEFDEDNVKSVLSFTRRLIRDKLAA